MKARRTKPNPNHSRLRNIGLARAVSKLGYCSRSQAAKLIRAGHVKLNGVVRRDPETPTHPDEDHIQVDNAPLAANEKIYLMLNKPRGVVTSASDEKDRETVYAYLPKNLPWVAPVGRLDKASEGLLLFTNDSEWAAHITAPDTHLDKTYHVQVGAIAEDSLLGSWRDGIRTDDGGFLRVKDARHLRRGERNSWLEIILDEGKNRQIRRLLEQHHLEVLRLVRVAIGPLVLGQLQKGAIRALTAEEKKTLDRVMQQAQPPPTSIDSPKFLV